MKAEEEEEGKKSLGQTRLVIHEKMSLVIDRVSECACWRIVLAESWFINIDSLRSRETRGVSMDKVLLYKQWSLIGRIGRACSMITLNCCG